MSTKELILRELLAADSQDEFISGQDLAKRSGFTRAAIWKAVDSLRKDGYEIEASTNHGYRISAKDIYNGQTITSNLTAENGAKIVFFDEIDSTNSEAKRRMIDVQPASLHKTAFIAATQTAGKGRLGRKFYSPGKTGVYLSLVYASGNIANPAFFTATAAVAVCRAIKQVFGIDGGIKWVNDVFVRGKKICGILTEGITNFETGQIEAAVIGIGVNVQPNPDIPEEIKEIVGSILEEPCSDQQKSKFVAQIINELIFLLDNENQQKHLAMEEYRSRSILIGKKIQFSPVAGDEKNTFHAIVTDISNDAALIVKMENGETKTLNSGEITIHSKNLIQ